MDDETRTKLKAILLRAKLNQFVNEEENAFARQCWRAWPKEYSLLQTEEVIPEAAQQSRARPSQQFNPPQPRRPGPARTPRKPPRRGRR